MKKRRGSLRHLKRSGALKTYPITQRKKIWTIKPDPGAHGSSKCIPLGVIVRDILGYAQNLWEAEKILSERQIEVDGKTVTSHKAPVGLMDVIHIKPTDEYYRILPHSQKVLTLKPISDEEAEYKLCRIEKKTTVKGGHIQLNLHDGRNRLIQIKDPLEPAEDVYKIYDTLKVSIPDQELLGHVELKEGVLVFITGGKNVGVRGRVASIASESRRPKTSIDIVTAEDQQTRTILDKVFVIGENEPWISM